MLMMSMHRAEAYLL